MEPCVSHDHDCDHSGCAGNSLWKVINHSSISCFNAQDDSLAKDVFRPWEQRRSRSPCLESNDDDAELLIRVPFTTDVKARVRLSPWHTTTGWLFGPGMAAPCPRLTPFTHS